MARHGLLTQSSGIGSPDQNMALRAIQRVLDDPSNHPLYFICLKAGEGEIGTRDPGILTVSHLRYDNVAVNSNWRTAMTHTSMLHVRVDDELKAEAAETLAGFGLTISDAVRILLTRITQEGGLPVGLTADPQAHDTWFRDKVKAALADTGPTVPHQQVMDEAQALIDKKRRRA